MSDKEKKSSDQVVIPVGKFFKNIWMIIAIILAIVVVVLIFMRTSDKNIVSENVAQQNLASFVDSQTQLKGQLTYVSTVREGEVYKTTVVFNGQEVPLYTTLDGKYVISNLVPLFGNLSVGSQNNVNSGQNVQPVNTGPNTVTNNPSNTTANNGANGTKLNNSNGGY